MFSLRAETSHSGGSPARRWTFATDSLDVEGGKGPARWVRPLVGEAWRGLEELILDQVLWGQGAKLHWSVSAASLTLITVF